MMNLVYSQGNAYGSSGNKPSVSPVFAIKRVNALSTSLFCVEAFFPYGMIICFWFSISLCKYKSLCKGKVDYGPPHYRGSTNIGGDRDTGYCEIIR